MVDMEGTTTIRLRISTKKRIDKLKLRPNESFSDALGRILKAVEIPGQNPELSFAEILGALEAEISGNTIPEERARKRTVFGANSPEG